MAASVANLTLAWGQAERPPPQHTPPAAPQAANPRRVTGCLHALLSDVSDPTRWMAARRLRIPTNSSTRSEEFEQLAERSDDGSL